MNAVLLVIAALAAEPERYDFERAVARVLADGVDPVSTGLAVDAAAADARTRERAWDPSLTVSAGASGSLDALATAGDALGASADLALSAAAPLWTGGENRARLEGARAGVDAALADHDAARQAAVLAVAERLLAVEEARATLAVREAALAAETATGARVQALVDAGARTRADLDQQRAAVAAAEAARIAAARALREAELDAIRLLRLDPRLPYAFVAPEAPPPVAPTAEAALATAAERRPELRGRAARVAAAAADRDAARAGLRPSLDASARADATAWPLAEGDTLDRTDLGTSVRLGLTVPVFDRGVTRGAVTGAEAQLADAALAEADAVEAVRVEVLRAWVRRESAEAALTAATARRGAADAALAVIEDRYAAGAALLVEVTAARAAAVEAATAEVLARVERVRAGFTLARATGTLLPR